MRLAHFAKPRGQCAPGWRRCRNLLVLLPAAVVLSAGLAAAEIDRRGGQFIGLRDLSAFHVTPGTNQHERVLTSRPLVTGLLWNELIVSWNADMPPQTYLRVEARPLYADRATKYYVLGQWSSAPTQFPRQSFKHQKDADGDVDTDTLLVTQRAERAEVRLVLGGLAGALPKVKFLGMHFLDSTARPAPLPPNRAAWGQTLPVPERSQMAYVGGEVWCSPATVSMLLGFWAAQCGRSDWARDVPEVASGVFDPVWGGTGNWVFNTAYAGALPGLRAYVTRLSDVAELETWVAQGLPVGLSLCYNRLRGASREPSGHLVVCVGFTRDGDAVINDPGTRQNVRKVFPRANLVDAWAYSKNAAYIIMPEERAAPKDRFGHWDSSTSRRWVRFAR